MAFGGSALVMDQKREPEQEPEQEQGRAGFHLPVALVAAALVGCSSSSFSCYTRVSTLSQCKLIGREDPGSVWSKSGSMR